MVTRSEAKTLIDRLDQADTVEDLKPIIQDIIEELVCVGDRLLEVDLGDS